MALRSTLALAALAGLSSAQVIKEPYLDNAVVGIPKLAEFLLPPAQEYTLAKWTPEEVQRGVPNNGRWAASLSEPDNEQYCADDFSVYNVTFADCPEPWIVGHCARAALDLDSTINLLARLPSNFRAAISDLINFYLPPGLSVVSGEGHSAAFSGALPVGHALELAVRATVFGDGVPLDAFIDAVNRDTCVADEDTANGLNNPNPNWAVAIYRAGMIGALLKIAGVEDGSTECMSNQLAVLEPILSARLDAPGACPNKAAPNLEKIYTILFTDGLEVLNAEPVPDGGVPTVEKWEDGAMPEWCWNQANAQRPGQDLPRCAAQNIEVYSVSYSDCPDQDPWVVCRCSDAQLSVDEMVTKFGRLPPGLRSYVRHFFVFDGTDANGNIGLSAGSSDDCIAFVGPCGDSVFMHEAAHSIDREFHNSEAFQQAMQSDSCLPTHYSRTSPAELFAEDSVAWIYNRNSKPLADRGYEPSCMANQLRAVGDYVGNEYTLSTSKCFTRRPNSPIINPAQIMTTMKQGYYVSDIVLEDFGGEGRVGASSLNSRRSQLDTDRWF